MNINIILNSVPLPFLETFLRDLDANICPGSESLTSSEGSKRSILAISITRRARHLADRSTTPHGGYEMFVHPTFGHTENPATSPAISMAEKLFEFIRGVGILICTLRAPSSNREVLCHRKFMITRVTSFILCLYYLRFNDVSISQICRILQNSRIPTTNQLCAVYQKSRRLSLHTRCFLPILTDSRIHRSIAIRESNTMHYTLLNIQSTVCQFPHINSTSTYILA